MLEKIAKTIQMAGGHAFLVGGPVRSYLLNQPVNDFDIEVYGLLPEELKRICESLGKVSEAGVSFAVLKLTIDGNTYDVSIPRTDRKVGSKHTDFIVNADPFMDKPLACSRRDFTINAMMQDILTGEILDFYNGKIDIQHGIIRHVDAMTFVEDSLRALRACQFAARLKFKIAEETLELCRTIDLSDLPAERIREELFKILLKADTPSIGITYLHQIEATLKLFPELLQSDLAVIDKASNLYSYQTEAEILTLMLAALLYKTKDPELFLEKLQIFTINSYNVRKQVLLLLEHVDKTVTMGRTKANFLKLANTGVDINLLTMLGIAVSSSTLPATFQLDYEAMHIEMENGRVKPVLMGKHLLDLGFEAGPRMGKILKEVFEKQLDDEINTLEDAISFVKNYL